MEQDQTIPIKIGDNSQVTYLQKNIIYKDPFGTVYLGLLNGQQTIAIKKIPLKYYISVNNGFHGIQFLKIMNHPNITKFYFFQKKNQHIYIVTQGFTSTLSNQIKNKLNEEQIFEYGYQIVDGLEYMHSKKVMHKDIKPDNIQIGIHGKIIIGEFGLAECVKQDDMYQPDSQTFFGTPIYCAPNVLDHKPYSPKCDVWSLGILFYQMIFGQIIFKAQSMTQLKKEQQKIQELVNAIEEKVSSFWFSIFRKTLKIDQKERATLHELKEIFVNEKLNKSAESAVPK